VLTTGEQERYDMQSLFGDILKCLKEMDVKNLDSANQRQFIAEAQKKHEACFDVFKHRKLYRVAIYI
jgi:hypothetical protein